MSERKRLVKTKEAAEFLDLVEGTLVVTSSRKVEFQRLSIELFAA